MELSLTTFENKILRKIFGAVFDAERGNWRIKFNDELREEPGVPYITNFIEIKKIKWQGHAMRRKNTKIKETTNYWNPLERGQQTDLKSAIEKQD